MSDKDAYIYKKEGTDIDSKIEDLMSGVETPGNADLFLHRPKRSAFAKKISQELKRKSWNLKLECNGKPSVGVRTIIGYLKEPFDAEAVAKRCVANPNSKYFGQRWEDVVASWSNKGQAAGAKGTGIDVYASYLFDNVPIDISSWSIEMQECCKNFAKLKAEVLDPVGAEVVCREQWLQDNRNIKGRLDALFNIHERLMLVDWKSNADIPRTNSFGTKMVGPCEMLDDCKANEFTLQLYIYKYFLKKFFDINVESVRIGWIRSTGYEMMKPNFPYDEAFIEECLAFGYQMHMQKNR